MKRLSFGLLLLTFFSTCGDGDLDIAPDARLKTKYIYSSSTASEPYAYTRYYYDGQGRLRKELSADYPYPLSSSYTYFYDSQGRIWNKKYNTKTGEIHAGITEDDFEVYREYRYEYFDDLQIETIFRHGELRDSVVYKRFGDLVLEEHHYDMLDGQEWHIYREFDSDGNLIKQTDLPDNYETVYIYEDSKLIRTIGYNDGEKSSESEYYYSWSGNKEIVECGYGGNIGVRSVYVNGNIIEYIVYHPTFQGSEWFCHRFEYY